MGTVYRAYDTQLQRDVAIKVLTATEDQVFFSQGKLRFINEAQITGQLQHPGVPPVHELGTLDDGRPFLAMKLVKGQTLRELLKRRSSPAEDRSRFIAIFEQVCHAIGYAHSHRILHRDLKPGNIMVGAHGEVQVMDWGLAKVLADQMEAAAKARNGAEVTSDARADDASLTAPFDTNGSTADRGDSATCTGQALGTPAYMAPEQAAGEIRNLDERADVFGLGAILCVILTGKPPYSGENAQEILLKAVHGELDDALERLEACTDEPELVALCRRCLSFDKADRPADGNAVAAEVVRIREAAESRARQAELEKTEALVREAEQRKRRRQVLVAAAAVVLALAIGMWRADENRRAAEAAKREAIAERDAKTEALAKLEVALEAEREAKELEKEARTQAMAALRFMTDDAVKDQIAEGKSHLSQKKKEYLNRVIEFYEGFAQIRGEREEARAIRAEGLYRVGKLQLYLGEPDAAQESLKKAGDLYRELVAAYPDRPEYQHELVQTLNQLAWVLIRASSAFEKAADLSNEAGVIGQWLVEQFPGVPEYQSALAKSHHNLASAYAQTSRYSQAEEEYKKAISQQKKLLVQFPEMPEYQSELARSHSNLAIVYAQTSHFGQAEEEYKKAIAIQEKTVERFPDIPEYQSELATSRNNLAMVCAQTGRYAAARKECRKAIAIRTRLVEQFPVVPEYRTRLASSYSNLGGLFLVVNRYAEAGEAIKKAITVEKKLLEWFPTVPQYQSRLASHYNKLAIVYRRTNRYADAKEEYKKAIALQKNLVEQFPGISRYRNELAHSYHNLALACYYTSDYAGAEKGHKEAIAIRKKLAEQFSEVPEYQSNLGYSHDSLGIVYAQASHYANAKEEHEKAIAIRKKLVEQFPDVAEYQNNLGHSYHNLAVACWNANDYSEAERNYKRAISIREKLAERFPGIPEYQSNLGWSYYNLALVYGRTNRYTEAKENYKKAWKVRQALVEKFPQDVQMKKNLAWTCKGLGDVYRVTNRYDEAEVAYAKALELMEESLQVSSRSESEWFDVDSFRNDLIRVYVWTKRYDKAKAMSDAAIADCEARLKIKPESKTYQQGLALHLVSRTLMLAALGKQEDAIASAKRLAALEYDAKEAAAWAAMGLSLAVRAVMENEELDEAARREAAETYAKEAIRMLDVAVQRGYDNANELRTDTDFDPIRERKDFQAIVERVAEGQ